MYDSVMGTSSYSIGFLLTKLGRIATRLYAEELEQLDLTPLQAGILGALASSTTCTQKQLMTALHMDKGTAHQMLK